MAHGKEGAKIRAPEENPIHGEACKTIARRFGLSEREEATLEQLSMGYTIKKISEAQCVSENTIKTHAKAIYRKIGCHSKQELIDQVERLMGEQGTGQL